MCEEKCACPECCLFFVLFMERSGERALAVMGVVQTKTVNHTYSKLYRYVNIAGEDLIF